MTARPDLAEIERLLEMPSLIQTAALAGAVPSLLARVRELEAIEREANEAILELQQQLCAQAGVPMPSERPVVEKLRARVAELEAALEWRPVESAPPQKVILLWALTDSETGNWKMATGHWCPGFRDEPGQWEWGGHRLQSYSVQPTHWLPLPLPPKERS